MRLLAGAGPNDEGNIGCRDTAPTTIPSSAELEIELARGSQVILDRGQLLGDRYEIQAFLGEGGMGAVYAALDRELGERVALKVVRGVGDRAALREEVRLAQKVTHRNVCRTYDFETFGECSFVKMEHVAGETLYMRLVREHSLAIGETIRIARELADGLAAAHVQGIVHRDLKPGNVMLDRSSRPVLMDFGLALQGDSGVGVLAAGTPGYMSPEQLAGTGVDARSDLYALGCLAYEMLTGERVFGLGTPVELAARHTMLAPPDPRRRRPDTPAWLARAVMLMLSKSPADRVAGAALLRHGPPRRRPTIAIVTSVVVLGCIALAWPRDWTPELAIVEPSLPWESSPPSISPDGTLVVYAGPASDDMDRLAYVVPVDRPAAAQVLLPESLRDVRWTRDGDAVLYVSPGGRIIEQQIARDPLRALGTAADRGPGAEPDDCGIRGIVLLRDNAIVRRDAEGDHLLVVGDEHRELHAPRCDASGTQVVYWAVDPERSDARAGDVHLVDANGIDQAITTDHRSRYPTFTPAGTIVYSSERAGRVNLYERAPRGGAPRRLTFGPGPDIGADVTADGARLVFDQDTTQSMIRRGGPDMAVELLTRELDHVFDPVPLPDGRVLAVRGDVFGDLLIIIEPGGAQRVLARGGHPAVSNGRRALYIDPNDPHVLREVALAGGPSRELARFPGELRVGCDAADGVHVGVSDPVTDKVRPWRVVAGGAPEPEHEQAEGIVYPAPAGGHRVRVARADRGRWNVTLYAPGDDLAGPGRWSTRADTPEVTWLDGDRIAYQLVRGYVIYSIAQAKTIGELPAPPMARLAPDGTWLDCDASGHITRQSITNFGERPASR